MAQLREGSVIKKAGGDEVIATIDDIDKKVPTEIVVGKEKPKNKETMWYQEL